MPDQDKAAPTVVVLQVVAESSGHIVVSQSRTQRGRASLPRHQLAQAGQSNLPVKRRERTAFGGKPGKLVADDVPLGGVRRHIAVGCSVCGDRRIYVETVDGRGGHSSPGFTRKAAIGGYYRCR